MNFLIKSVLSQFIKDEWCFWLYDSSELHIIVHELWRNLFKDTDVLWGTVLDKGL